MTPAPNWPHQDISWLLIGSLRPAVRVAKLPIAGGVNVRLTEDRLVIPDLVVADNGRQGLVTDAAQVVLVGEITSPSNATVDRQQKKLFYASAGINWYLLAEPDMREYRSIGLRLFRLPGDQYVQHAVAEYGQTLISDDPFPIEIRTAELLDF